MSSRIRVLQLGPVDFSVQYQIHPDIDWSYEPELIKLGDKPFDAVIIDRNINAVERERLFYLTKAYCLFVTEDRAPSNEDTQWLEASKKGVRVNYLQLQNLLKDGITDYFSTSYGEKFNPRDLSIRDNFQGSIEWDGFTGVLLNGEFGKNFRQIAYWRNNIPVFKDQSIDFWLEYEKSESVELRLSITQFVSGATDRKQNFWCFDEENMKDVVYITNVQEDGPIFVSLLAKGSGELRINGLHNRYSRRGKGYFLPGGERRVTSNREELFFYFDPGDMKPPLNLYFSGYKTMEGFEGYNIMRRLGAPFLIISDPRLEGGAFFLGSDEYEQMMCDGIRHYIDELGFSVNQTIFSGFSMGAFGALYYGCDFKPFAIIVGKPMASLGDVASNERINRPGGFPTSLDVLWKQYETLNEDAVTKMNNRFWSKFDAVKWGKTKFIVSYMIEDDYDGNAYPNLLSHIDDDYIEVYGRGLHGRNNDNNNGIVSWFISRYDNLMNDNFEREFK